MPSSIKLATPPRLRSSVDVQTALYRFISLFMYPAPSAFRLTSLAASNVNSATIERVSYLIRPASERTNIDAAKF